MGGSGKGEESGEAAYVQKGKGKGKLSGKGKGFGKDGKGKGKGKDGKGKGKDGKGAPRWVQVKPTVLVTGASGYLAMSVIRRLTDNRYKVRGTVRSLSDESKVASLKKLFPALELFEADLLAGAGSFEKAMEGCKYVMHTASPFQSSAKDPQTEFVDPALQGTDSVMRAAVKAGVTRIVVTSSIAAVGPPQEWIDDPSSADKEKVFTEEDWNKSSTLESGAYRLSKRLAEEKAWEIAKESAISLTVLNPSFIIGPMLSSRADGVSVNFIKDMLDGTIKKNGCSGFPFAIVDVRDVSLAHVKAIETEKAGGQRFLLCSDTGINRIELADAIRDSFKAYAIPEEGTKAEYVAKYDNSKAKEVLKFRPRPVASSMRDMANAAIRHGIVERKVFLKPVKFGIVSDTFPDGKGLNFLVKVVSVGEEQELPSGKKSTEVVVGDATGIVTLQLTEDEARVAELGKIVEVRNAAVKMTKGFIRVQVGKWGKISAHVGETEIIPKLDKNVSATEFELVQA